MADVVTAQSSAREEAPERRIVKDAAGYTWAVGRRKAAAARVRVRPGSGTIVVNSRELNDYFPDARWRESVLASLRVLERKDGYDIVANVKGGGQTGQAEALSLAIARAISFIDPEAYTPLREAGLLTRDARVVERKKYGLRGARRAFQFSKR